MKFAQWLESDQYNPKIVLQFLSDGRIFANIEGRKYQYITHAAIHETWKRKIDYIKSKRPQAYNKVCFDILNSIKKMVINGTAQQIDSNPMSKPNFLKAKIQQKLPFDL